MYREQFIKDTPDMNNLYFTIYMYSFLTHLSQKAYNVQWATLVTHHFPGPAFLDKKAGIEHFSW